MLGRDLVTALAGDGEDAVGLTRGELDITDEAAITSTFTKFDAAGVAIDILINNAGIQLRKPNWANTQMMLLTTRMLFQPLRTATPRTYGVSIRKVTYMGSMSSSGGQ